MRMAKSSISVLLKCKVKEVDETASSTFQIIQNKNFLHISTKEFSYLI